MKNLQISHAVAASLAGLFVLVSPALSAPPVEVAVENHSFEDPILADGEFGNTGVTPWSTDPQFGPINLFEFLTNGPVPDGENVAFSSLAKGDELAEQVLDVSLCENDEITLTVAVGERTADFTFGGYYIALLAEAADTTRTLLAEVSSTDDGALIPAPGDFVDVTLEAMIKGNALSGQTLVIQIGSDAEQGVNQTLFDDVRLTIQTHSLQVPSCYDTIQDAINAAEDGDEVVIQEGQYFETIDFLGKDITVRGSDPEDGETTYFTQIIHPEADAMLVGMPTSLVTFTSGEGPDALLTGVTLMGGNVHIARGALVYIEDSSPTITHCIMVDGHADLVGGAMYIENSHTVVEDCYLEFNFASVEGGAVYVAQFGSPNFTRCYFKRNYAELGGGGAIYVSNNGDLELTDCELKENHANTLGGALCLDTRRSTWITGCYFRDNFAQIGGAVASSESAPMFMYTQFRNNRSCDDGGAVFAYAGSSMFVGCEFRRNHSFRGKGCGGGPTTGIDAGLGGGAYAQNYGDVSFEDCIFTNNEARPAGGAISLQDVDCSIIDSMLFCNTSAYAGGGLYAARGFTSIRRSRIAGNYTGAHDYGFGGGVALSMYGNEENANNGGGGEPEPLGEIINSVIVFNTSSGFEQPGQGGGIGINGTGVDIVNCTVAYNYTDCDDCLGTERFGSNPGGGMFIDNPGPLDVDIDNCIVWGNMYGQIGVETRDGAQPLSGYINLAFSDVQDDFPDGVEDLGGNISAYPRFINPEGMLPCEDDEEPPFNFGLRNNSPCIDAANTPALEAVFGQEYDVRLSPRVLDDIGVDDTGVAGENGAVVDMGAREFQGESMPDCNAADLAADFGVLDFNDVLMFLTAFADQDPMADFAVPFGTFDFDDVLEYITMFAEDCDP